LVFLFAYNTRLASGKRRVFPAEISGLHL